MYETYTRQSLPLKYYRELLGSALCVFNSNIAFLIENILNYDDKHGFNWYQLMDMTSGELKKYTTIITSKTKSYRIGVLFADLVEIRNRIIHSFQFTDIDGEQRLATKDRDNKQYVISEEYLLSFMRMNEEFCLELYATRDGKK